MQGAQLRSLRQVTCCRGCDSCMHSCSTKFADIGKQSTGVFLSPPKSFPFFPPLTMTVEEKMFGNDAAVPAGCHLSRHGRIGYVLTLLLCRGLIHEMNPSAGAFEHPWPRGPSAESEVTTMLYHLFCLVLRGGATGCRRAPPLSAPSWPEGRGLCGMFVGACSPQI